jgi:hypothetical protein
MGDQEKHRILLFKAASCFNVTYAGEIQMPAKIRPINSLQVDGDDRLWVSTDGKDDYNNASIYTWAADRW